MNPQHGEDGQLNDRSKWKPFKVVCINSQSQGVRMKRLREECCLVEVSNTLTDAHHVVAYSAWMK